ncbi:DUF4062 domain-containing protein [Lactococcus petauri]
MEKKYQVFISSTYTDLINERQTVVESILNAGHIPAGMELFKAGPTQEETIEEWIKESDIYVLILGARYGTMKNEEISYTQWEYNLAKELGKPMFSIVLSDEYIQKMANDQKIEVKDVETSNPLYKEFKKEVMQSLVIIANHSAEIRLGVSDSIREIERKYPEKLEGWIKGKYLNELEELRKSNKELTNKLVSRQEEVIDMKKEISAVKDVFIGEYSFEHVKNKLSEKPIITDDVYSKVESLEFSMEKRDENHPDDRGYNFDEKNLEKIKYIIENEFSASQMLIQCKEELLLGSIRLENGFYSDLMNQFYYTKWYEMSLIDKEHVPGKSIPIANFSQYVPEYDRIKLNDRGIKYLNMLEMEKKK